MPTLKKPFSLLLILSHLNAFVLSDILFGGFYSEVIGGLIFGKVCGGGFCGGTKNA
jgi:hypothetical protein